MSDNGLVLLGLDSAGGEHVEQIGDQESWLLVVNSFPVDLELLVGNLAQCFCQTLKDIRATSP